MGVDLFVLDFLARSRSSLGTGFGETLTLGRQGLHIKPADRDAAAEVVRKYFPEATYSDLCDGGTYADKLFRFLGSSSVEAMDISAFEGAGILHDLNRPVPSDLSERFDCIFDGGTIEHVYNVPQAFDNVARMLKPDGVFLLVNAANNQLGHGMYQFSPELLWTAFSEENGFRIECIQLMDLCRPPLGRPTLNPRDAGRRVEIGRTANPTYIMMAARKAARHRPIEAYQSDYVAKWQASAENPGVEIMPPEAGALPAPSPAGD